MANLPMVLEYGLLGMALVASVVLAAIGKLPTNDALAIITSVVGYGVGAAKGTSLANAVIGGNLVTSVPASQK